MTTWLNPGFDVKREAVKRLADGTANLALWLASRTTDTSLSPAKHCGRLVAPFGKRPLVLRIIHAVAILSPP
jgi:hypothetical protein